MIEIKDSEKRLTAVADSNGKLLVSKGTMQTDSTNGICNSFFCWSSPRNWPINSFSLCNDASFVTGLVGHFNVVSTFIVEVNNISLKIKKIFKLMCLLHETTLIRTWSNTDLIFRHSYDPINIYSGSMNKCECTG